MKSEGQVKFQRGVLIDLLLLIAFLSLLVLSKKRMVKLLVSRTLKAVLIFSFGVGARDGGDRTENYLVVMKGDRRKVSSNLIFRKTSQPSWID